MVVVLHPYLQRIIAHVLVAHVHYPEPCRNYPRDRDVGIGTKLWKAGMDRVYLPFYRSFMIKDQGEHSPSSALTTGLQR